MVDQISEIDYMDHDVINFGIKNQSTAFVMTDINTDFNIKYQIPMYH